MKSLIAIVVLFCSFNQASASFITAKPFGETGVSVYMDGEIRSGDLAKLQARFATTRAALKSYSGSAVENFVFLSSVGGNLDEAIAIGRWIRSTGMTVIVLPGRECYSSCVYILASGLYRRVAGKVGIHRPYLTTTPSAGIDKTMKSALRTSQDYFAVMNVPSQLADAMFSIPPDSIEILDENTLTFYRLNQTDLGHQEAIDLKNANYYGLSRVEYMIRNKRYEQEREKCNLPPGIQLYECWEIAKSRAGLINRNRSGGR